MSLFLLDTDILSLLQAGNPQVLHHINQHLFSEIAHSSISLQEQMQSILAAVNRARNSQQLARVHDQLVTRLLPVWSWFSALPFTEPAILRFEQLKLMRLNVGVMDLRISAIALENGLTVVTRNLRDFGRVPGLTCADWSV